VEYLSIGKNFERLDALDKVNGRFRYTNDFDFPGLLKTAILKSPYAHARIKSIDTKEAEKIPQVRAILTGKDFPVNLGVYLGDKSPLAYDKVRYFG